MAMQGRAKGTELIKRREFILRRACWYGRVTVQDVRDAFDVSRQIASKDLTEAVKHWTWIDEAGAVHPVLSRGTRAVIPIYPIRFLEAASPKRMLQLLAAKAEFPVTGLREKEISVLFPEDRASNVLPEVLSILLQAVLDRSSQGLASRIVVIRYVGMKVGDVYRERRIVPVALEFDGGQTRVYAHDMDAAQEGYPIKAFVLTRVAQAWFSSERPPKDFKRGVPDPHKTRRLRVTFDPRLTEDQKDALRRELGIHDGVLMIPENQIHAFRRFYTNGLPADAQPNIIWPPIIFVEKED